MKQKQQPHLPPAFKAKAAMEAIKERPSIAQTAGACRVHPTQVGVCKRQQLDAAPLAFTQSLDHTAATHESLVANGG